MRRFAALIAALAILLTVSAPAYAGRRWSAPAPAPMVDSGGGCAGVRNDHVFVRRIATLTSLTATYYDDISGIATVTNPPICVGIPGTRGGSFILPANAETGGSGAYRIFQVGYGREPGQQEVHFVYADGDPTTQQITSINPVIGQDYKFRVYRRTSGYASLEIWEGASQIWRKDTMVTWQDPDIGWWGYETLTTQDVHDGTPTSGRARMRAMTYSHNDSASQVTVSGLLCNGGANTPFDWIIHKDFNWDGSGNPYPNIPGWGSPCAGTRAAYIGTYQYTGDQFDVWTTD